MPSKKWTVGAVLEYHPCHCYGEKEITALWAGREALSLREILALEIRAQDRIWFVCQKGVLSKQRREQLFVRIAGRAIRRALDSPVTDRWRQWAEDWLSGKDQSARAAMEEAKAAGTMRHWFAALAAAGKAAGNLQTVSMRAASSIRWQRSGCTSRIVAKYESQEYESQILDVLAVLE